jgi:integrase
MLLGRALADDQSPTTPGKQLSKWTLASRRSAIRDFVALLHPEVSKLIGHDARDLVATSLRLVAERVGMGFRLNGGAPRRRGGIVPTSEQVAAILEALGQVGGFRGKRNVAFVRIQVESATRPNALRSLDGADCIPMPHGLPRLYLHDKGKTEPRQVELSTAAVEAFKEYADAFNREALRRGWRARVVLGCAGPLWRNSGRSMWPYADLCRTLRAACERAGVPPLTPHAFRRAFATIATTERHLPRQTVALAGGWRGSERMDNHYIRATCGKQRQA